MASPRPPAAAPSATGSRYLEEIEHAQAVATSSRLAVAEHGLAVTRATEVARDAERQELADVATRAALVHSWRLPITNPVETSGFGYRWGLLHAGEDFAVSTGTPLAAMSTGTVIYAGPESGYGVLVEVRYWDGTISYYGHMSKVSVNVARPSSPATLLGCPATPATRRVPICTWRSIPTAGQPSIPCPG